MRPLLLILSLSLCVSCGGRRPVVSGECTPERKVFPLEPWAHVQEGSAVTWATNPPASGKHYPRWARYQIHENVVPRPYWVHNLEHGAIVFLYHPDAPAEIVAALKEVFDALPADSQCGHARAVMTGDPELSTVTAVVAATQVLEGSCVVEQSIVDFVKERRGLGPENVCVDGTYP